MGASIAAYDYKVEWIQEPEQLFKDSVESQSKLLEEIYQLEIIRAAKAPKKPKRGRRFKKPKDKLFRVAEEVSEIEFNDSEESNTPGFNFRLRLNQDSANLRATEFISKVSGLEISGYRLVKTATVFSEQVSPLENERPKLLVNV